jgi:hypothetical protein
MSFVIAHAMAAHDAAGANSYAATEAANTRAAS